MAAAPDMAAAGTAQPSLRSVTTSAGRYDVFIFRPKRTDRVKILVYDGTGLVLYAKRLEAGRFSWPSPAEGVVRLSTAQLATLLEGLPWHRLQPRAISRPSTAW
jgi:transposase